MKTFHGPGPPRSFRSSGFTLGLLALTVVVLFAAPGPGSPRAKDADRDGPQALVMLSEKVSHASARELDDLEALIRQRREELEG